MKKVPIIFAINDFIVGGAQKLIVDMLNELDCSKYEFHLITFFEFNDKSNFYSLVNPKVTIHRLKFAGVFDLKQWIQLIKLIVSIKPRAVISNLFFSNFIMRVLSVFFRYKISIVEHNTYINKKKFHILLDKILSLFTFKIVCVSDTVFQSVQSQLNISTKKIITIYNGVDIKNIFNICQKNANIKKIDLGFNEDDKIILNVARLTKQKNHQLLINFFHLFIKKYPELSVKLVILGEGQLFPTLTSQINDLDLLKSVQLLGNRDPFPYYLISDMLVSTSTIEGLSIAYLEAFACGLPIISTRTAGTDNLIIDGGNGYFIEPVTQAVFDEKILSIIKNGKNVYRSEVLKSVSRYSIAETCNAYEKLLNSMVK